MREAAAALRRMGGAPLRRRSGRMGAEATPPATTTLYDPGGSKRRRRRGGAPEGEGAARASRLYLREGRVASLPLVPREEPEGPRPAGRHASFARSVKTPSCLVLPAGFRRVTGRPSSSSSSSSSSFRVTESLSHVSSPPFLATRLPRVVRELPLPPPRPC